jgi:hypothetical protein
MARDIQAAAKIGIPKDNRAILCLDGGGIRGIMTIQLLRTLEQVAGVPCHKLFDMVAGTSTGGIIAGLIAAGKSADEIEGMYTKFVKLVFKKRNIFASRFVNPPAYTKSQYRQALKDTLGNLTLKQACTATGIDLMITAKDAAEGEETYFSCLSTALAVPAGSAPGTGGEFMGTYSNVLLRAVMEATMSAPTFFTPLERFIDGGTTTYNNPTMAAFTEAVRYGPKGKYSADKLTLMSFGTGYRPQFVKSADIPNPSGLDVAFWLQYVMSESGHDASDMQGYFLRGGLCPNLDYRRFQISLDSTAVRKLPNLELSHADATPANWLYDLTDADLAGIEMDNVAQFDVMRTIGAAMSQYVVEYAQKNQFPPFGRDLTDSGGADLLVTREGDINRINQQMSDPQWLDSFQP